MTRPDARLTDAEVREQIAYILEGMDEDRFHDADSDAQVEMLKELLAARRALRRIAGMGARCDTVGGRLAAAIVTAQKALGTNRRK